MRYKYRKVQRYAGLTAGKWPAYISEYTGNNLILTDRQTDRQTDRGTQNVNVYPTAEKERDLVHRKIKPK